jgi:hypothetical protein
MGGRSPALDTEGDQQRTVVERAITMLKGFRAVATRYDCEDIFGGTVDVASIRIRIRLRDPVRLFRGTRPGDRRHSRLQCR